MTYSDLEETIKVSHIFENMGRYTLDFMKFQLVTYRVERAAERMTSNE